MTDGSRPENRSSTPAERPTGDSAYADAYAAGYGEGLREALREMMQHASRGHTAAELRILLESRLARVAEDTELKRRSLTAPPRRPAWGPLLRSPTGAPSGLSAGAPSDALPAWSAGGSYLFREERPAAGIRFVRRIADRHAQLLWVSADDPPELALAPERASHVRPSARPTADGTTVGTGPGEVAGAIQRATERGGPVLVYLDALEFFLTEYGTEPTLRFATWLGSWAKETGSTAVVSVDPGTMEERDRRRLQRAFGTLV